MAATSDIKLDNIEALPQNLVVHYLNNALVSFGEKLDMLGRSCERKFLILNSRIHRLSSALLLIEKKLGTLMQG